MRQPRLFAPPSWSSACYHCVSRVVDRQHVLGDEEKAEFIRLMRLYEKLCQVRVLTYCLMSNHFHLLVCLILSVPLLKHLHPHVKPPSLA